MKDLLPRCMVMRGEGLSSRIVYKCPPADLLSVEQQQGVTCEAHPGRGVGEAAVKRRNASSNLAAGRAGADLQTSARWGSFDRQGRAARTEFALGGRRAFVRGGGGDACEGCESKRD